MTRNRSAALVLAAFVFAASAHADEKFRGRLYPVPIDQSLRAEVTGNGSIAAVLDGHKLSITGTFQGLRSAATMAQLHQSPVTGVRGPVILDLTVSKASSGSVNGSFELTDEQANLLRKGRLYVQIHSEKAPDGNLWGWLLH